ncbi:transglutaminaseTgpA domain-containing protein [Kitasatospora sp. NPDC052896]|uniref:transglutaminase family protein n=1 Tax=Kitasatospora sp. NPDC052896 TaxID=3364061 RepID=UPI0037CC39EE
MTAGARLTFSATAATGLATLSLTPLLKPAGWLVPALSLLLVNALVGMGLRRVARHPLLVVAGQLLVLCYLLLLGAVRPSLIGGLLPGPATPGAVSDLLSSAGSDIRLYAIPAPATPGLRFLLIASVAVVAVLVDALAVTHRRAAPAGLPLLALFTVGCGLAGSSGAAWLWFLLAATGYLALLYAEGRDRLSRWGRVFRGPTAGNGADSTALAAGGQLIGVLALAVALILPGLAPNLDLSLINRNPDAGAGNGDSIDALNPVVSLADGLRDQRSEDLIHYHSDSPDAASSYLRITSLDDFTGVEWKPSQQDTEPVPGTLPPPDGLSTATASSTMQTQVVVSGQLSTQWLPAPYPMTRADPSGDWRYEPVSRSLIGDSGQKATGLSYTVTSLLPRPTADQLRQAGPAPASVTGRDLALPSNLPSVVRSTALQVTQGLDDDYDKAMALQAYFATSGLFTYSSQVDPGTGPAAIAKFLQDKKGFCVHFAASMAAMARTLGIPARVAVGFAPGRSLGNGNYVVGSQDYHAWPELYFQGAGWLRFEPTPTRGTPPDYSGSLPVPATSAPTDGQSAVPSGQPTALPATGGGCPAQLSRAGDCPGKQAPVTTTATGSTVGGGTVLPALLAWVGGGLLVLLLLLLPMLWRARLRRGRLGGGRRPGAPDGGLTDAAVLAAWTELVDSAWDLGILPDEAHSPRHTGQWLTEAAGLEGPAREAVGRVALATERVLYARDPEPSAPLGADVRTVRDGLRAAAGRRQRLRAVLLPASLARPVRQALDRLAVLRQRGRAGADRALAGLRRGRHE